MSMATETAGLPIARFDDLDAARRVLLGRRSLEDTALPEYIGAKIREVFDADLTRARWWIASLPTCAAMVTRPCGVTRP